ncbi:DUF3825 domain-containing protein [Brevibacillus agri]|uniref:DUF3825 domain-containing protein n=1 Tax=Brevibacillus agri TaxID=51101 RepID=UPI003D1D84AD
MTVSNLYEWAICKGQNRKLRQLSLLALEEDWSGGTKPAQDVDSEFFVLWKYIHHTFRYLIRKESHKIFENSDYGCFNTGLEARIGYEEIFAFFQKNKDGRLELIGFYEESNNILDPIRGNLPEPANYLLDPADFIFDTNKPMTYKVKHIFERQHRLPKVIETIPPQYREDIIENRLRRAHKRVKRNYKLAIPQYSPRLDEIQLLIPICIEDENIADCALAVTKVNNTYKGKTILTMAMAYNNARLITKPDPAWLKPSKDIDDVEDEEDEEGIIITPEQVGE